MDQLAVEHFRTLLTDSFRTEFDRVYGDGRQMDADDIAGQVGGQFPEAYYEFRTNEAGVPVRRLVLHGEWLVDLTVAEQAARQRG